MELYVNDKGESDVHIKTNFQIVSPQVAEAISIAIGVEVEIVDTDLTILGGTGIYAAMIGQKKEESGRLDSNYLYAEEFSEAA